MRATALFINQQEAGLEFTSDDNRFSFAGVELLPERGNLILVPGFNNTHPRQLKPDTVP
jgi:hypothetical protein